MTQQYMDSYVYLWIKPNDNVPFYVGHGKGNRAFSYHYTSTTPKTSNGKLVDLSPAKCQQVWDFTPGCKVYFVLTNLTKQEAYKLERFIIQRLIDNNVKLTNVSHVPKIK